MNPLRAFIHFARDDSAGGDCVAIGAGFPFDFPSLPRARSGQAVGPLVKSLLRNSCRALKRTRFFALLKPQRLRAGLTNAAAARLD